MNSQSPGRVRRHSIFLTKSRELTSSEQSNTLPSNDQYFKAYVNALVERYQTEISQITRENEQNLRLINDLHARIQRNEKTFAQRQVSIVRQRPSPDPQLRQIVQAVVEEELDKRFQAVAKRVSEIETLIVEKVFRPPTPKHDEAHNKEMVEAKMQELKNSIDEKLKLIASDSRKINEKSYQYSKYLADNLAIQELQVQRLLSSIDVLSSQLQAYKLRISELESRSREIEAQAFFTVRTEQRAPQNLTSRYNRPQVINFEAKSPFEAEVLTNFTKDSTLGLDQPIFRSRYEATHSAGSLRERLLQLARTKNLRLPIEANLNEGNLLTRADGSYLFDLRGDLFRCRSKEFSTLCQEGFLKYTFV